ncbi:MAG TPA: RsmB/NOP family class I SAM-dependent RNA methyltransferase [Clostridia bacterium]|nr:RsmB/NOP family class I SAM-dependent RNA methyltransferase [Clostridia bacterium]
MNPETLELAEQVIRGASREQPADRLLRDTLKRNTGLGARDRSDVSRAVFAYYRWFGWLDHDAPMEQGIGRALELAAQFAERPESIRDPELCSRGVPEWAKAEMEITPVFVRALQHEPKVWLRARPGQASSLHARLEGSRIFRRGLVTDALDYRGKEDLFRTPEFHAGEFELQDLSSQAVSAVCAPTPGETWWDACAGEGGKLLHLSDLMQNKGLIWASDIAGWRLQKLKRRAARAKIFNYRAVEWNGKAKLPTKTRFDGVLVDATCTGTGTWQRNPHARWTTTPQDVRELSELQSQLLAHAAAAVKPGGKLIYAVCSLTRSETNVVADAFEAAQSGEFQPLPLPDPFAPNHSAARLSLLPQEFGGNGMFIAAWRRRQ